ncbi:MAG: maleylpyruvate isomerase family mycothiol-dependent enzyme [Acidimicrobiia bacterium]
MTTDPELVDALAGTWAAIAEIGEALSDAEWRTATALPGWTVHDVVAHIAATEAMLLGRRVPEHHAANYDYVRNDLGRVVEDMVDWYRPWRGPDVLNEFRSVTSERLSQLRALDEDGFTAPAWNPFGTGDVHRLLEFRLVDSWVHEHDIRFALNFEQSWSGIAADVAYQQLRSGMGKVVAREVAAPEGTQVQWDLGSRVFGVVVRDGRGILAACDAPTVTLTMTEATFFQLATGRGARDVLFAEVTYAGNAALGARIADAMNVMV